MHHNSKVSAEQLSSSLVVQPKAVRALPMKSDASKIRLSPSHATSDTSSSSNKPPPKGMFSASVTLGIYQCGCVAMIDYRSPTMFGGSIGSSSSSSAPKAMPKATNPFARNPDASKSGHSKRAKQLRRDV